MVLDRIFGFTIWIVCVYIYIYIYIYIHMYRKIPWKMDMANKWKKSDPNGGCLLLLLLVFFFFFCCCCCCCPFVVLFACRFVVLSFVGCWFVVLLFCLFCCFVDKAQKMQGKPFFTTPAETHGGLLFGNQKDWDAAAKRVWGKSMGSGHGDHFSNSRIEPEPLSQGQGWEGKKNIMGPLYLFRRGKKNHGCFQKLGYPKMDGL